MFFHFSEYFLLFLTFQTSFTKKDFMNTLFP